MSKRPESARPVSSGPRPQSSRPPKGEDAPAKPGPPKAGPAPTPRRPSGSDSKDIAGRVRVVVRLRPRSAKEKAGDNDFADVVVLDTEIKRVTLRKNHWESESFYFDGVLPDHSSQRKVYETVTLPVVESVFAGYNGTVMAYGQTGTGKTHTLGNLGLDDKSMRGMIVRAIEDAFALAESDIEFNTTFKMTYVQLYMEMVQDLLAPEGLNIQLFEDPQSKEVTMPGVTETTLESAEHAMKVLEKANKNRVVANQKMNASSSRSHALLFLTVIRQPKDPESNNSIVLLRRGRLCLVDLAGSERITKSGSTGLMADEAKFINLSLTTLGKCINMLADAQPGFVPYRESKLTRLLKDSFGGTARTSLIITIGPNPEHYQETSSTLQFGQRALKVANTLKLQEEVDYRLLSRRQQAEIDGLVDSVEKLEGDCAKLEDSLTKSTETIAVMTKTHEEARIYFETTMARTQKDAAELLDSERKRLTTHYEAKLKAAEDSIASLKKELQGQQQKHEEEVSKLKSDAKKEGARQEKKLSEAHADLEKEQAGRREEAALAARVKSALERQLHEEKSSLQAVKKEKLSLEMEVEQLQEKIKVLTAPPPPPKKGTKETPPPVEEEMKVDDEASTSTAEMKNIISMQSKEVEHLKVQLAMTTKLFEQVGVATLLNLLASDDNDICRTAAKALANLAAQEAHQEDIVKLGGLKALFTTIQRSQDETTHRLAAGAIANLAMSESNQVRIVEEGGVPVLTELSRRATDPQTQRMIAGAIANLCGNASLKQALVDSGGMRAFIAMSGSNHPDVLAQVARGIANFVVKYEKAEQFFEEGGLPCLIEMASNSSLPVKKHAGLALYSLSQKESNVRPILESGALKALLAMRKCEREGVQRMAEKTLNLLMRHDDRVRGMIADIEAQEAASSRA